MKGNNDAMYKQMIPATVFHRGAAVQTSAEQSDAPGLSAGTAPVRTADHSAGLEELKDRYLRLAADFENYRKRNARETESRARAEKEAFIRELLPLLDNLERALAGASAASSEQVREGIEMILHQFIQLLGRHGYQRREDLGERFDPRFHDAIAVRSESAQPDNTILEVWERGWTRGRELFRPAKVIVNARSVADSAAPESETELEEVTS